MKTWHDVAEASDADILEWAEAQPWARAMAACNQDPGWHAEGDVWTHTRMVADELHKLDEWPALDRRSQLQLLFTALFHDSGKPDTTAIDPETGRVRSPKHALRGVEIGRDVLRGLGSELGFREEIMDLVRYHGRPPFLLEKDDPAREMISLSWAVDHRLLYLFALADTRGRLAKDSGRSEDALELWKTTSEEHNCFGRPYQFQNDHARFLFFRDQLSSLYYAPREDYRCAATVMAGVPGAGKDRWLADHRPGLPVVSLDDIRADLEVEPTEDQGRVAQAAQAMCREHLRDGRDFAFNATNIIRRTRKRWIDLFADYHARIEIIYVEPPLPIIYRRNEARERSVPRRVIDRLLERLEPPALTEAHRVEYEG